MTSCIKNMSILVCVTNMLNLFNLKLEDELKEHIQTKGALTLKILFKNNHPDGKPLVNR